MQRSVVLMICGLSVFVSGIRYEQDKAYCFQYRWFGPLTPVNYWNCTGSKTTPCIEPAINSTNYMPPNPADYWKVNEDMEELCVLSPGNVCVTYTFLYNNAVMNTSKYCGKVTESKSVAIPITNGCFSQYVDGHHVRVCVCQSNQGSYPCNASAKPGSSIMTVLILSLVSSVTLWRFWNMRIT